MVKIFESLENIKLVIKRKSIKYDLKLKQTRAETHAMKINCELLLNIFFHK